MEPWAEPLSPFVGSEHVTFPSRGLPVTDMGWEIQPDGLHPMRVIIPPTLVRRDGA